MSQNAVMPMARRGHRLLDESGILVRRPQVVPKDSIGLRGEGAFHWGSMPSSDPRSVQ